MSEAFDESEGAKRSSGRKHRAKVAALKTTKSVARGGQSGASSTAPSPWKAVRFGFLVLVLCIAFGVQSAYQSQRMRALYSDLQKDQIAQDALLAQRSRLLIERGAMSSYNGTEIIAVEQLRMRFPERIVRVPNPLGEGSEMSLRGQH